jgi:hypothetical protein
MGQATTHLLILLLFFLDPKSPCRNKIGAVFWSVTGFAGSCRSYASGTVSGVVVDEYHLLAAKRKLGVDGRARLKRLGVAIIYYYGMLAQRTERNYEMNEIPARTSNSCRSHGPRFATRSRVRRNYSAGARALLRHAELDSTEDIVREVWGVHLV